MQNIKNQKGQGLVEYILIVVVMALLAVGAIRALGKNIHNSFSAASTALGDDLKNANQNIGNSKVIS